MLVKINQQIFQEEIKEIKVSSFEKWKVLSFKK